MNRPYKHDVMTCVVYEAQSGRIVHTHSIMSLPGARTPTQEELEKEALELIRQREAHRELDVRILHLQTEDAHALPSAGKVDPVAQRLIMRK